MSAPAPAPVVAPLRLPPIAEETLPNGLSVVTATRKDLPLVAVRLVLQSGAARDPKGKEGVASLTGSVLRRGTKERSGDQIDDGIESIGGLLGVDVGAESTSIAVTVPSEHVATALEIVADLARAPSFPKKQVDQSRRQVLAHLQNELDDPSALADRALVEYFYGKNHPFGHPIEGRTASVKTLERADVVAFHKATYTPAGAMLIFVGDMDPAQAKALATKFFADWKGKALEPLALEAPAAPNGFDVLLVDKADATQAQVRAVVPGLARKDPAYYPATVANTIVGGGFTSRLVDEVRVNRGLSYSVGTRLVAMREFGAISFSTFTKTETVREILDVSFGVMDAFREKGPTADEVEKARRYVIGLYPGRVESIDHFAEALASARLTGIPFTEIAEYRGKVASVVPDAASVVARRWPSKQGAKVVVVGAASKIRPQLEGLGKVTVVKAAAYK